jgi:hypothetical protein
MDDNELRRGNLEETKLLNVSPFNYGGDVYLIMFNTPPHLMAHVCVYDNGNDHNAPEVRSFSVD